MKNERQTLFAGLFTALGLFVSSNTNSSAAEPLETWNIRTSPLPKTDLRAVVYGNGNFVATGAPGSHVLKSPDGVTWTAHETGNSKGTTAIAFGAGQFVIVGSYSRIYSSPDGTTWTRQDPGTTGHFNDVTYLNGLFLVAGDSGILVSSPDGVHWTPHSAPAGAHYLKSITWGNGLYVAVGYDYKAWKGIILTSPDLDEWTLRASGLLAFPHSVVFANGLFVVAADHGVTMSSPNGIDWPPQEQHNTGRLDRVIYAEGYYVVTGWKGSILYSQDGTEWHLDAYEPRKELWGVTYGAGTFVAVGDDGTIVQSPTVAGAEPANAKLAAQGMETGEFFFQFQGALGTLYGVEFSPDLKTWVPLGSVMCDSSPRVLSHPGAPGTQGFYRLVKP